MSNALVSVVIPTYNRAYCITRAIDCVLNQTHGQTEVIVIDDGSRDGTGDLIRRTYAGDERVRYFYQENRGVTAARNYGLSLVSGDFVALLDSDDTWASWKLELQLACMERCPEIGMVWSDMEAVNGEGEVISEAFLHTRYDAYRWFSREELFSRSIPLAETAPGLKQVVGDRALYTGDIFSQMIMGNLVHTSTVLLRRERLEKIRGFNEELRIAGEDYDFHLRTCREGPVGFMDVSSIRYQIDMADRLSVDAYKMQVASNCLRTILPPIQRERSRIKLPDAMIRFRLAEVHGWFGALLLDAGDLPRARAELFSSLRQKPWQPRILKLLALASMPKNVSHRLRSLVQGLKAKGRVNVCGEVAITKVR